MDHLITNIYGRCLTLLARMRYNISNQAESEEIPNSQTTSDDAESSSLPPESQPISLQHLPETSSDPFIRVDLKRDILHLKDHPEARANTKHPTEAEDPTKTNSLDQWLINATNQSQPAESFNNASANDRDSLNQFSTQWSSLLKFKDYNAMVYTNTETSTDLARVETVLSQSQLPEPSESQSKEQEAEEPVAPEPVEAKKPRGGKSKTNLKQEKSKTGLKQDAANPTQAAGKEGQKSQKEEKKGKSAKEPKNDENKKTISPSIKGAPTEPKAPTTEQTEDRKSVRRKKSKTVNQVKKEPSDLALTSACKSSLLKSLKKKHPNADDDLLSNEICAEKLAKALTNAKNKNIPEISCNSPTLVPKLQPELIELPDTMLQVALDKSIEENEQDNAKNKSTTDTFRESQQLSPVKALKENTVPTATKLVQVAEEELWATLARIRAITAETTKISDSYTQSIKTLFRNLDVQIEKMYSKEIQEIEQLFYEAKTAIFDNEEIDVLPSFLKLE